MLANIRFHSLFLLTFILLGSCSPKAGKEDKPIVSVSIEPLRFFTENIGGDRITVNSLVPKGSSPETYEPTSRQMEALSHSQLLILVGSLGFEVTWMAKFSSNYPDLLIHDSSEGIRRLGADGSKISDPHTWMSAQNALIIADNIYKSLCVICPDDSLYFKEKLHNLKTSIEATGDSVSLLLDNLDSRCFIIHHPSLTYFALDYDLCQIAIEQEGKEPSAKSLSKTISDAISQDAKVILTQEELDSRNIETVAKATGANVETINPLGYNWNAVMLDIAMKIASHQNSLQND